MVYGLRVAMFVAFISLALLRCTKGVSDGSADIYKQAVIARCGSRTALYNTTPMAPTQIAGIGPMGGYSPPTHVFPIDHIFLYLPVISAVSTLGDVVAPGDVVVTQVSRTVWTAPTAFTEYKIWFQPCTEHLAFFDHIGNLDPSILAQIGPFVSPGCSSSPGKTVCTQTVSFALTAGTFLGQAGGTISPALEFGASDTRNVPLVFLDPAAILNPPVDLYAVCPLDYFDPTDKALLYAKLGDSTGTIPRTVAPLCGNIVPDLAATAKGKWFNPLFPKFLEAAHMTLGSDNANPANGVLSIGSTVTFASADSYTFPAVAVGPYNRDFSTITVDGKVYCYQVLTLGNGAPTPQLFLVQLTSATTLRIEAFVQADCGGGPWAFDPWSVTFQR